jgi:uroporphyrinogen decarboxylase
MFGKCGGRKSVDHFSHMRPARKEFSVSYQSRERVARILAHQQADRVPFCTSHPPDAGFVEVIDSLDLSADQRACYMEGDFKYIVFRHRPSRETYLSYLPGLPGSAALNEWGVGEVALYTEEGYVAGRTRYHPLAGLNTVAELEKYPWPDFTDPKVHTHLEEEVQATKARGFTTIGQMSQTILETAYCMRGMEQLFVDLHERPDYTDFLFEKLAERRRFQARRFIEAGIDIIRIGDDIATQHSLIVGPELYRRRLKPFHASVIDAARQAKPGVPVLYHSDGKLTGLLPDLIEAGVTGIHPVQAECMDLAAAKRDFGRQLLFWGCLPTQSIFAHGTGDQVRKYLRYIMEAGAPGGGLVVEFYNALPTPKLMDNVRIFYEEFYDLARY